MTDSDFKAVSNEDLGRKLLICADGGVSPADDIVREAGARLLDVNGCATTFFTARNQGKLVFQIHQDGSVEFGEGVEPEDAAKQFYNYVCAFIRAYGLNGSDNDEGAGDKP